MDRVWRLCVFCVDVENYNTQRCSRESIFTGQGAYPGRRRLLPILDNDES